MKSLILLLLGGILLCGKVKSAEPDSLAQINKRRWLTGTTGTLVYGGSMLALNHLWYADYPRSGLHSFDDSREWLQMDKAGHFFTAWYIGVTGIRSAEWMKIKGDKAVWMGGALGLAFLTGIEFLDGTSEQWGFSWSDMAANTLGAGLAISQQLAWKKQRFLLKFSYRKSPESLIRPQLLGEGWSQRWLKDYNGQTYWLSFSPGAFFPSLGLPSWLCLSVGYSANGMLGAEDNLWGNAPVNDFSHIPRTRELFLSADIDLSAIPIRARWYRTFTTWFNFMKIPFPGVNVINGQMYWLVP